MTLLKGQFSQGPMLKDYLCLFTFVLVTEKSRLMKRSSSQRPLFLKLQDSIRPLPSPPPRPSSTCILDSVLFSPILSFVHFSPADILYKHMTPSTSGIHLLNQLCPSPGLPQHRISTGKRNIWIPVRRTWAGLTSPQLHRSISFLF